MYLLAFFSAVFQWVKYFWNFIRRYIEALKLPTIKSTCPFLGHAHHYIFGDLKETVPSFITKMCLEASSRNINQFCFWAGPYPQLYVHNPEDIQVVLSSRKTISKGPGYALSRFFTGQGLVTSHSQVIWRTTRQAVKPMFSSRNLEHFTPRFNDLGKRMVIQWEKYLNKGEIDVFPEVLPLIMLPSFHLLFGTQIKLHPTADAAGDIIKCIQKCFQLWTARIFSSLLHIDLIFKFLYARDLSYVNKVMSSVTKRALQVVRNRSLDCSTDSENAKQVLNSEFSLLDAFTPLMEKSPKFVEDHFEHNVFSILAAGSESSSITLSSCMLVLAWYPNIQDKLYAEISTTLKDLNKEVSNEDLKRLTYMDLVLKETLRMFPVFPLLSRVAKEDIRLSFGLIPAGSAIHIHLDAVHMNPHIYPEPEEFRPERFLPENVTKRHKFSYLAFSGGPRNCIGKDYAVMLVKATLVHIVYNYRLSTSADMTDMKLTYAIEQFRTNGYPISLQKREQSH